VELFDLVQYGMVGGMAAMVLFIIFEAVFDRRKSP
jgi:hypothetical protein